MFSLKNKKTKKLNTARTIDRKLFDYLEKTFGTVHALNILMVEKNIRPAYYNILSSTDENITNLENIINDLKLRIKYKIKSSNSNSKNILVMIYKRGDFDIKKKRGHYNTGKFLGYPCPSNLSDLNRNENYNYSLRYWKKKIYYFDRNNNKITTKNINIGPNNEMEIFTFICDKNSKAYITYMVNKGKKLKQTLNSLGLNDIDIISVQRHEC